MGFATLVGAVCHISTFSPFVVITKQELSGARFSFKQTTLTNFLKWLVCCFSVSCIFCFLFLSAFFINCYCSFYLI